MASDTGPPKPVAVSVSSSGVGASTSVSVIGEVVGVVSTEVASAMSIQVRLPKLAGISDCAGALASVVLVNDQLRGVKLTVTLCKPSTAKLPVTW